MFLRVSQKQMLPAVEAAGICFNSVQILFLIFALSFILCPQWSSVTWTCVCSFICAPHTRLRYLFFGDGRHLCPTVDPVLVAWCGWGKSVLGPPLTKCLNRKYRMLLWVITLHLYTKSAEINYWFMIKWNMFKCKLHMFPGQDFLPSLSRVPLR